VREGKKEKTLDIHKATKFTRFGRKKYQLPNFNDGY
jgi:hypothetical protein